MAAEAHERVEAIVKSVGVRNSEILIEQGEPAKAVSMTAKQLDADLLVIGRSPAEGLLGRLRTTSYAIIRESPCPVVSV